MSIPQQNAPLPGPEMQRLVRTSCRALIPAREDPRRFFEDIVTNPLSLVLFVAAILVFVSQISLWRLVKS